MCFDCLSNIHTNAGCICLCEGLRSNSTLKQLSLAYCSIGDPGSSSSENDSHAQQQGKCGEALGQLLSNVKSNLEVLNLTGNRVTGQVLIPLCRGLQQNSTLKQLDLSDNKIDGKVILSYLPYCKFHILIL